MTASGEGRRLRVARCPSCGLVVYPSTVGACPRCTASPLVLDVAHGDGVIWSCTVQRFAPKSPPYVPPDSGFEPFAVAYVETADGLRVEGIVATPDPAEVRIGQSVRLVSCEDVPRFELVRDDAVRAG
jgi:uncharacterized protein